MIDRVPGNGAGHGGRPGEYALPSDEPRHSATEGHDRAPHDGIRFHELAELTEEGFIQVDDRARVSFVNTRLARMLRTSIDVLIGRPVTDVVAEEERAAMLADLEELLSGRVDVGRAVRRIRWADQPVIWAQVAARAPRGAQSGQFGLVSRPGHCRFCLELPRGARCESRHLPTLSTADL